MTADSLRAYAVSTQDLRKACDALAHAFEHSDQLPEGTPYLGQQRAVDAIRFGIQMQRPGYNIYVLGPLGSHRHRLVEELVIERATTEGPPDDWCYVNNFADPERPSALSFPAGLGSAFRDDMRGLIEDMQSAIPAAFEGDDYRNQLKAIEEATQKEVESLWKSLDELASGEGIGVLQTPTGYVLAPLQDGKVIGDKEFDRLPETKRKEIQAAIQRLGEELQTRIEQMPKLRKQLRERVKALNRDVTAGAVSVLLNELKEKYQGMPKVSAYLDAAQQNIIDNAEDFQQPESPALPFMRRDSSQLLAQYEVNLLVDNLDKTSAPIVFEPNPSYPNIIGKIEHRAEMGALVTDFRMVRSGALLQANGGYLLLNIDRVLSRPFVWEALKQALMSNSVRIETPGESWGLVSTTTLKPEPIPFDVKIILIGERWLYYLLSMYDREFDELFKVAADLEDDVDRSDENVEEYGRLIADRAKASELLPLNAAALRQVIEQRARQAQDGERLSMHMRSLDDLLIQSDYWARQRQSSLIEPQDIDEAIGQREHRLERTRSRIMDAIQRDVLLIDTSGSCVGQVNGLSVIDLGEFRYGHPVRITATTRIGTGEVVDIEREVELGGAIHSKGMLILSSALTARYSPETPLSLYGSVVFEQSYGGVEGDSASVAELCALLSSLARVPILQNLAVTGSLNQLGRVQVVGGVNEKIEGFFRVCKARGLDGSHGVIIPRDNVKHLMLRQEVIDAAAAEQFTVYAVKHVDEALSILTGCEAGQRDEAGKFPEGSVNGKVEQQLIRYATLRQEFGEKAGKDEQE